MTARPNWPGGHARIGDPYGANPAGGDRRCGAFARWRRTP